MIINTGRSVVIITLPMQDMGAYHLLPVQEMGDHHSSHNGLCTIYCMLHTICYTRDQELILSLSMREVGYEHIPCHEENGL